MSSDHELSLKETKKEYHGSLIAYFIGFILSLILTGLSFLLVAFEVLPPQVLMYTIVGLALFQALIQMIFFLHLGQEDHPQWETMIFYFMVLVLAIIVLGTLWIMYDLNARTMMAM
jgi:cytochrome o ubiquinol oxidase operon protein cyoD